jgi:hypothetical protein
MYTISLVVGGGAIIKRRDNIFPPNIRAIISNYFWGFWVPEQTGEMFPLRLINFNVERVPKSELIIA